MPTRAVAAGTAPSAPARAVTHTFPGHRRSVGRARDVLRDQLAIWHVGGEVAYRAALLLSELATNAIRARTTNGRRIGVRFELTGAELRIEVSDSGDGKPELRQAEADDESGRGLALVEALAAAWGVSPRDGVGKTVWVLLVLSDMDGAVS